MLLAGMFVRGLWRQNIGRARRPAAAPDDPQDYDQDYDEDTEFDESQHGLILS